MTDPTMSLSLVTFADLAAAIKAKRDGARDDRSTAGWQRLYEVAQGLAVDDAQEELVAGRSWRLWRVRVQGYQGVSAEHPLEIEFDVTPGITVLHGPNGCGKSSVADAVDTALRGSPRQPVASGSGGKLPLWEREHCGRDAEQATVEVTLAHRTERLVLTCELDPSGDVIERTCLWQQGEQSTAVDLEGAWQSALAGHQPVFGYAAIERRVQVAKDLQGFLEPLLALGGCFAALEAAVEDAAAPAKDAAVRWQVALTGAKSAAAAVDAERRRPGLDELPAIAWPQPDAEPEDWLKAQGLGDTGEVLAEVTGAHRFRCSDAAEAVNLALDALQAGEHSLHGQLAVPLRGLLNEGESLDDPGRDCPVCSTGNVAWLDQLSTSLQGLTALSDLHDQASSALRGLGQAVEGDLADILQVLDAIAAPEPAAGCRDRLRSAGQDLAEVLCGQGHQATADVRDRARRLTALLRSTDFVEVSREAERQSEHARQWRLARRTAVKPLLATMRDGGTLAEQAVAWEAAGKHLRTVQNDLRRDRADALRTVTARSVERLLSDVGLQVAGLTVTQREAKVEVTDAGGQPLPLSMLSAGQRNAVLLAPLLALRGDGPFGFLVLDDPVHAFDAVRVDRLATTIRQLAQTRRVVVLTHDERLREHLAAQDPHVDLRTVHRDAVTGEVTVDVSAAAWQVLLDDAQSTLDLGATHGATSTTDIVRGLCRMALDDALWAALLSTEVDAGRDPEPALAALDTKSTTAQRLEHVITHAPTGSDLRRRAETARDELQPYLLGWNRATHGNDPSSTADRQEVAAALGACTSLTGGQ